MLSKEKLEVLARKNPVLAYRYLCSPGSQPNLYSFQVTFQSSAPDVTLNATQPIAIGSDFWVTDMTYSVERPAFMVGSVWKAQADNANALSPSVNCFFEVAGGNPARWGMCAQETPIQHVARWTNGQWSNDWLRDWVLCVPESINGTFRLTRTLQDGEFPYQVVVAIKGQTLPCNGYLFNMPPDQAVARIKKEFPSYAGCLV